MGFGDVSGRNLGSELASTGRMAEARRHGVPAFRILTDRTLKTLATSHPATTEALLAVPGIGSSTVAKYGTNICRVLRDNGA